MAASLNGLHILIVPSWWPSPEQPIAGVFCVDYARAFAAAGAKVGVIVPDLVSLRRVRWRSPPPIVPRVSEESACGIPVVRVRGLHTALGRPAIHMQRFLRWLERGAARYAEVHGTPDVIHAHCAIPAGWAALRLGQAASVPVVITEHTGPFSLALAPPVAGAMTRTALMQAGCAAAVSPGLASQMRDAGIERSIEVIPNPVGSEFTFAPPPPRDIGGQASIRIVFVGRLVRDKGVRALAQAMMQADARLQLDVVGDGDEEPSLRGLLAPLIANRRVRFHGFRDKAGVAEILRAGHALVLPSYGENCPLAIAESLCVGRPVVTTSGTGCEAMLDPGDGLLCPPRDAAALADALHRMMSAYDRWDAADIARRAAARFSGQAVAGRYVELFGRVVAPRG